MITNSDTTHKEKQIQLSGLLQDASEIISRFHMIRYRECLNKLSLQVKTDNYIAAQVWELKRILNEEALLKVIPRQKKILGGSFHELKLRYEKEAPKLKRLQRKKEEVEKKINLLIEEMLPEVCDCINQYFVYLNSDIPAWVSEYQPMSKIQLPYPERDTVLFTVEVVSNLKERAENKRILWLYDIVLPLMADKADYILMSVEEELQYFYKKLDQITDRVNGIETDAKEIGSWQRAASGWLLLSKSRRELLECLDEFPDRPGKALQNTLNHELRQALSSELAWELALRLGACAGNTVFDLLNPMALSDVTAKTIYAAKAKGHYFLENHAMLKIVQVTQKQLSDRYLAATQVMLSECRKNGAAFADMLAGSLEMEIGEFEIQVQELIGQMEQGQEEVEFRKAEIALDEERIKVIDQVLDRDFRSELQ